MTTRRALVVLPLAAAACGASPTRTSLSVVASEGLNPNSADQPSPLLVRIYELKSVDVFNQLQFFDLLDQDVARLGADLLNRRELEIAPGRTLTFEREADAAARFLGVIAGYRDLVNIQWRASAPLTPGARNRLRITLDARSMSLAPVRRARFLGIF